MTSAIKSSRWHHRNAMNVLIIMGLSSTAAIAPASAKTPSIVPASGMNDIVGPQYLAQANPNQPRPQAVQRAYDLLEQGLVDDAIQAFSNALQNTPNSVDAQLGLAIAYRQAGFDESAFEAYQQVLTLDPNNQLALTALGVLGTYRPEWQSTGIDALTALLNLDPNNVEARSQRALLLFYQGQSQNAIADYRQVLAANDNSPLVWIGAAQVYAYGGLYQDSIELFQRYLSRGYTLTANEASAFAFALRQTGDFAGAIEVLEPQLNHLPGDTGPDQLALRGALAAAYAGNGQTSTALAVLAPLQGRPDARLTLARALNDVGRYSNSEALTEESIILYKQILASPDLTVGIAREIAEVLSGYPNEQTTTLALYQQLYRQNPNDISLYLQQSIWERQLAQISAQELRRRFQATPLPTDASQLNYIAQGLVRLDPPDPLLIPIYQSLVEQNVDEPFLNFRLAQLYLQRNDLVAARTALGRYADAPTADEGTLFLLLAELERREGNVASSELRYQTLIADEDSDNALRTGALQGLAGLRQGQGRTEDALALFDQVIALNPDDQTKILGRANIAYQGGRLSEAQASGLVNQWLTDHPLDTPPELFSLVGSLPPEASRAQLYAALLAINPQDLKIQQRQIQLLAMADPAAAQALAAEVVAANPNTFDSYLLQGRVAQDVSDLETASRAYQAVLSLNPNQVEALAALGGVRFEQRRYGEARRLYDQALVLAPTDLNLRQASISLTIAQDRPISALREMEALQIELAASGNPSYALGQQRQRLQEGFLLQRGFQPVWERY